MSQADISLWMAHPDINEAVGGLIRTTLNAGAPDNVTVVIAEVRRDTASARAFSGIVCRDIHTGTPVPDESRQGLPRFA